MGVASDFAQMPSHTTFGARRRRMIFCLVGTAALCLLWTDRFVRRHYKVNEGSWSRTSLNRLSAELSRSSSHFVTNVMSEGLDIDDSFPVNLRDPTMPSMDRALAINEVLMTKYLEKGQGSSAIQDAVNMMPDCRMMPHLEERYAYLKAYTLYHPVFISISLWNSETVIPTLSRSLLMVLARLTAHNVHVSIFENASSDQTLPQLKSLGAALEAMGIGGLTIKSIPFSSDYDHNNRIVILANIRNQGLKSLYESGGIGPDGKSKYDTVVFYNDVVHCEADALEVIHQRISQQADQSCSTDWEFSGEDGHLYDLWVARGLNGDMIYNHDEEHLLSIITSSDLDLVRGAFKNGDEQWWSRWIRGLTVPVYSCWNGITAIDASLFTEDGLQFRAAKSEGWELGRDGHESNRWRETIAHYADDECAASECSLLDRDIWHLRSGKARILISSQSRVAYDVPGYNTTVRKVPVQALGPEEDLKEDGTLLDLIDWEKVKHPEDVICAPWKGNGRWLDPWNKDASWEPW